MVETKVSFRLLCRMVAKRGGVGQIWHRMGSLVIRCQCLCRIVLSSGLCIEYGVENTKEGDSLEVGLLRNSEGEDIITL